MDMLFKTMQVLGAAGTVASIVALFQSGEESIAVLNQLSCSNSDILNNDAFENWMNTILPLTVGLYVLCMAMVKKFSDNDHIQSSFTVIKHIIIHLPIIFIIIQTTAIGVSVCSAPAADAQVQSIKTMGYSFVVLAVSMFLSTTFGKVKLKDEDSPVYSSNYIKILDSLLRLTTFALIVANIDSTDTKNSDYFDNSANTCHAYYDNLDYTAIPSSNISGWKTLAIVLLSFSALEFTLHFADFFTATKGYGEIFETGIGGFFLNFLIGICRSVLVMFIAGFVLERSNPACNPFVSVENARFKTTIVLATVTFIPNVLSQQLEWEEVPKAINFLYSRLKTKGYFGASTTESLFA